MQVRDYVTSSSEQVKSGFKNFITDFTQLVKLRLTLTVVLSASIAFLLGAKQQGSIDWINWFFLVIGGFFVTGSANGFNEIIEKDSDKLMKRTAQRPLPANRMTTGQALVISLFLGISGTLILSHLNFVAGIISVFSLILYAFVYTPLKSISSIAVWVGALPGALPPLIGFFAAFSQDNLALYSQYNERAIILIPAVLLFIQFLWQFPHFWAIACVADEDYKKAGIRLLPTKKKDTVSAVMFFISCVIMVPAGFLPLHYGFGGIYFVVITTLLGIAFSWLGYKHLIKKDTQTAKKVMFMSIIYLPVSQLALLFDFIAL